MLYLLRSDFYKVRKARYFWICLLITILLAVGTIFILDFSYKIMGSQMAGQMAAQQQMLDENNVNITMEGVVPTSYEDLSASKQMILFFAGNTTLILAVFVSLFVGSEFNHGTIKTIATRNYSRVSIYASKLIASVVVGVFYTLIHALCATLTATILWGFGKPDNGYWLEFFPSVGLELLLTAAFISIFVMFSMMIRQNGGSLAVNIGFLEFLSLFILLGEMVINKIFDKKIALSDYLIDTNMNAIAAGLDQAIVIRSLCVGIGFFLAAMLIGMVNFQKRDIKQVDPFKDEAKIRFSYSQEALPCGA